MRNTKPIRKTTPYELSELLHEVGDPGLEVDLDCRDFMRQAETQNRRCKLND